MKLHIAPDARCLARRAAVLLEGLLLERPGSRIGLASGPIAFKVLGSVARTLAKEPDGGVVARLIQVDGAANVPANDGRSRDLEEALRPFPSTTFERRLLRGSSPSRLRSALERTLAEAPLDALSIEIGSDAA